MQQVLEGESGLLLNTGGSGYRSLTFHPPSDGKATRLANTINCTGVSNTVKKVALQNSKILGALFLKDVPKVLHEAQQLMVDNFDLNETEALNIEARAGQKMALRYGILTFIGAGMTAGGGVGMAQSGGYPDGVLGGISFALVAVGAVAFVVGMFALCYKDKLVWPSVKDEARETIQAKHNERNVLEFLIRRSQELTNQIKSQPSGSVPLQSAGFPTPLSVN